NRLLRRVQIHAPCLSSPHRDRTVRPMEGNGSDFPPLLQFAAKRDIAPALYNFVVGVCYPQQARNSSRVGPSSTQLFLRGAIWPPLFCFANFLGPNRILPLISAALTWRPLRFRLYPTSSDPFVDSRYRNALILGRTRQVHAAIWVTAIELERRQVYLVEDFN